LTDLRSFQKMLEVVVAPNLGPRFGKLATRIGAFRLPLQGSVRSVAVPSITENFEAGGNPPWARLAASTIAQKGHDRPLFERGAGMASATALARWHVAHDEAEYRGDSFPRSTEYMKFHQSGTERMPARPFAVLQDDDEREVNSVFHAWMDAQIRASGL
jgi:phage gpG-like protein